MGYAGSPANDGPTLSTVIVAFMALALYNAVELNVIIFSSFKRRRSLYFWSILAATKREEREQKEREKTRKRRRRDSDGSAAGILVNQYHRCGTGSGVAPNIPPSPNIVFPTSPLARLNIPREDAVKAYSAWHQAQVCTEEQKQHYDAARQLTGAMLRSQHSYSQ
jgi:hypothetical protein